MGPFIRSAAVLTVLLGMMLLASCSGTGDSGDTTDPRIGLSPLILPEQLTVVDPQGGGGSGKPDLAKSGSVPPLAIGAIFSDLPTSSEYVNDRVSVYVNERSLESFRTVNEILCMVGQSRYDAMLNRGPYRAQVDKNLCSSNRSDASSAGQSTTDQSSGASRPDYEEWVIDSSRASSQAPHIVKVWVHSQPNDPSDPEELIYARLVITESSDMAPPYGVFTLNFKVYFPPDLSTVRYKGFLNAEREPGGTVLLKFSAEDKDSFSIDKATLDKASDGSGGSGSVFRAESFPGESPTATRFNLAYDATNFLRTDNTGSSVCLDRKNYDVSTWRYALYTNGTPTGAPVGKRVKVNAGFPVQVGSTYGWVGYHGSWFPPNVTVNDGDTVVKHDYATNTNTAYTLVKKGGKLKQHTRKQIKLGDIKNIPLVWWDNAGNTYLVIWDGAAMQITAQLIPGSNGQVWETLTPASPFPLNSLTWVDLGFWSQSLGGFTVIKFPAPASLVTSSPTATNCGYDTTSGFYDCSPPAANNTVDVTAVQDNLIF